MRGFSWRDTFAVFRKEILDTLRDRRTLMAMVVVPLLVYPILIIVISQVGIRQVQKLRDTTARVMIVPEGAAPTLETVFAADSTFLRTTAEDPDLALEERELDVIVQVPGDFEARLARGVDLVILARVDLSRDRGQEIKRRTEDILVDWRRDLVEQRLGEQGLSEEFLKPFSISVDNAAGTKKMGGSMVGRFLPFLLVVMMMTGALYPAIDVTAGERERGTLETLLVSPAGRFSMVLGKYMTVFVASMVTALANLLSMAFTVFYLIGSANLGGDFGADLPALLDWRAFFLVFLIMIPMGLFFCGLAMLVASFARSFKEAQNYLSPLIFACLAPAYITLIPGLELSYEFALVPIANVVLLSRELLLGNYAWDYFVLTMATMSGFALLLLGATVQLFGGEGMLGGDDGGRRLSLKSLLPGGGKRESLNPGIVGQVFALVLLGFFYIGGPLQLWDVEKGLVITQLLVIAGIPLVAMRLYRVPIRESLRMGRVRPAVLAAALVMAPGATLVAAIAAALQGTIIEVPEAYEELMRQIVSMGGESGVLLAVFVFAVVPGFCEELLFRGFVLRGLRTRFSPRTAILLSAVLFGVFHFDLYRLLPTTLLGVVLGWVAWRTGRLWPSVAIHVANNTVAVLAINLPALQGVGWLQGTESPPLTVIAVAAACGLFGFWALRRLGSEPERKPAEVPVQSLPGDR